MTTNNRAWNFINKNELLRMESTNKWLPKQFQSEKMLDYLKRCIEESVNHLAHNEGQEIKVYEEPFLTIKKNTEEWIGAQKNTITTKETNVDNHAVVYTSEKMKLVMNIVRKVSLVDSTVLLLGETGVGKSLIARQLHKYSNRDRKPFAEINCSTIPEDLMEAELFGYTPGSFTGGNKGGKKGIFESTIGGTVFLDEIGEVPLHLQAKLLEVLQENHIRPIGSIDSIPVDVRIIAATNRNLEEMVQEKLFREDLFYRLNVVPISIPSLRDRMDELEFLLTYFLDSYNDKHQTEKFFSTDLLEALLNYSWPGNIRELKHMIERLVVTTEENQLSTQHLPVSLLTKKRDRSIEELPPLKEAKEEFEREIIMKTYKLYKTTYKAAEALQVNQSTIAKKIKQYRDEGFL